MTTKNCAGTYKVSGYKREDGTKVDSYWRTCGAKHENSDNSTSSHPTSKSKDGVMTGAAAGVDVNINDRAKYYNYILSADIQDKLSSEQLADLQGKLMSEQFIKLLNVVNRKIEFPYDFLKYYKISLDMDNQKKFDKSNMYTKLGQIDDDIKYFIKSKYSQQNINNSTDVVVVQYGTSLMNNIINSKEFIDALAKEKTNIKKGVYKNNSFSISFKDDFNLFLTIGKCNIYNPCFHKDGTFTATLVDYYDFEYLNYVPSVKGAIINAINNNAVIQQENGDLTNFVLISPIILFENSDI